MRASGRVRTVCMCVCACTLRRDFIQCTQCQASLWVSIRLFTAVVVQYQGRATLSVYLLYRVLRIKVPGREERRHSSGLTWTKNGLLYLELSSIFLKGTEGKLFLSVCIMFSVLNM